MPSMAITWAQRLKRVFNINVETCLRCGDAVTVIACIEDPAVVEKILTHRVSKTPPEYRPLPKSRAPPAGLFG